MIFSTLESLKKPRYYPGTKLRMNTVAKDMALGLYFGYPLCCIGNFIRLGLDNKLAFKHMAKIHGKDKVRCGYVRCHSCVDNPKPVVRREEHLDMASKYCDRQELINEVLT